MRFLKFRLEDLGDSDSSDEEDVVVEVVKKEVQEEPIDKNKSIYC
jgi:hypothetical protein